MKIRTIVCLLLVMVVSATMEQTIYRDKRGSQVDDVLSYSICHYLKVKGYLKSNAKMRDLCLAVYHCDDLLSKKSCSVFKRRSECSKKAKFMQIYCPFTCNKCPALPSCKTNVPLGMQSKAIPDSQLYASSFYSSSYSPSYTRLHMRHTGWLPKSSNGQWLLIDLGKKKIITGIATQGGYNNNYWIKSYTLKYSNDGKVFLDYQSGKVFKGNSDRHTVIKHDLSPRIYARYIKIYPKTWHGWPVLRMELYGCK